VPSFLALLLPPPCPLPCAQRAIPFALPPAVPCSSPCRDREMKLNILQARDVHLRPALQAACSEELAVFCQDVQPGGVRWGGVPQGCPGAPGWLVAGALVGWWVGGLVGWWLRDGGKVLTPGTAS